MIRSDALQAADRDGLAFGLALFGKAAAAAGWLAGPIAGTPENSREHVRFAIEHVGIGETALRNQSDVFGNVGVGRASPLAIDDLVKIPRVVNVGACQ